jgi:hypothetical protein
MSIFTPVTKTEPFDASDRDEVLYRKSFHLLRMIVGCIGVLLPIALLIGHFGLTYGLEVRGSLSSYYHSGMRDIFVSSMCAIGIFLVSYKIAERNLDNTATAIAGVAAIGVAIFPTNRIKSEAGEAIGPLTPLQDALGEHTTASVHFACACVTMVCLAVVSFYFGQRDTNVRRRRLHYTCAALMVLTLIVTGISSWLDLFGKHAVLIGEVITLWAFGVSWFSKGYERAVVGTRTPRE